MHDMQRHCPVCQRYCGPRQKCPYCEATMPFPLLYRRIKRVAWLLATVGLLLLILASRNHKPDTVLISTITPAMQYARIYVEGELMQAPQVSHSKNSASANIDDGSGKTLRVVFLDDAVDTLLALTHPLEKGTKMRVTGGLSIKANQPPVMFVRQKEQFTQIKEAKGAR